MSNYISKRLSSTIFQTRKQYLYSNQSNTHLICLGCEVTPQGLQGLQGYNSRVITSELLGLLTRSYSGLLMRSYRGYRGYNPRL